MKIGILTFVGTQSHGACLQAYALKKAVLSLGVEAEIVNYHCKKIDDVKTSKLPKNAKNIKKFVGAVLKYPVYKKRWEKFESFEHEHLGLTKVLSKNELDSLYDKFIVGSDQIWNLEITGNDFTYFLDFTNDKNKKLTYAASLGADSFLSAEEQKCFKLVNEFQAINVREKQLQTYISNSLKKEVSCVIDPTLLIDKSEWYKMSGEVPLHKEKYLFVHAPKESKENWNLIYKIAKERNLKIVYLTNKIYKKKDCKCLYSVSPLEYINYIRYAEFVITGSFHTLSFSLIFNRQFLCTDSMVAGRNSRISNLLETAGCCNRLTSAIKNNNIPEIEYSLVDENIKKQSEYSMNILKKCLGREGME